MISKSGQLRNSSVRSLIQLRVASSNHHVSWSSHDCFEIIYQKCKVELKCFVKQWLNVIGNISSKHCSLELRLICIKLQFKVLTMEKCYPFLGKLVIQKNEQVGFQITNVNHWSLQSSLHVSSQRQLIPNN